MLTKRFQISMWRRCFPVTFIWVNGAAELRRKRLDNWKMPHVLAAHHNAFYLHHLRKESQHGHTNLAGSSVA